MTTQLDVIPFHNTQVLTVKINDKPYVLLKPVFEAIGVDADRQISNIQKRSWSCTAVTSVQLGDQRRNMIAADMRTFLMALATIPSSRVNPNARPLLEAYQAEVADVIEAYYSKGAVINPRVAEEQLPAVLNEAYAGYRSAQEKAIVEAALEARAAAEAATEQIKFLGMAVSVGLIDQQWGQTKAQVVIARGLGEVAAIPNDEMPLYVEEFMRSQGVSHSKVARFSGAFGKKVLAQAESEGIKIPGKRIQELPDGSIRWITAWTKEHQPLFERAWRSSYANDARLRS